MVLPLNKLVPITCAADPRISMVPVVAVKVPLLVMVPAICNVLFVTVNEELLEILMFLTAPVAPVLNTGLLATLGICIFELRLGNEPHDQLPGTFQSVLMAPVQTCCITVTVTFVRVRLKQPVPAFDSA